MMCDSRQSSMPRPAARTPAQRSPAAQHLVNTSSRSLDGHDRDQDHPPPSGRVSPSLATLPPPPPTPCSMPSARRHATAPSARPNSERTPPRLAAEGRVKKVQSSPDVPPPLLPRQPNSSTPPSRSPATPGRRPLPQSNSIANDSDLLNLSVPPPLATRNPSNTR